MNFIANESPTKLRGGYYTSSKVAAFLARWVLELRPVKLLEPSCGDGAFFEALARCKPSSLESVTGFEIDVTEAAKASARASLLEGVSTKVHVRDFLDWSLKHLWIPEGFDGVLGNPPFIRYQYLSNTAQVQAEKLFALLRLGFTRHTNAWVPFVLSSLCQLRPGGRLAMVVPAELLHVLHAQSLRSFLLEQCERILLVDPRELLFQGALQGTVLLMAEKKTTEEPRQRGRLAILSIHGEHFLDMEPGELFQQADFVEGDTLPHKWMPALLSSDERQCLAALRQHAEVKRFQDVAEVDVGIVTGANKFFLITDEVVARYELAHWAHPMFGRSEHVQGVVYDQQSHEQNAARGLPVNFLHFGDVAQSSLPAKAQAYLQEGVEQRLHLRYKCRIRTPWYSVPSVWAAPIAMLKRSHTFPRLVLNEAQCLTTDTAYRITTKGVDAARLTWCFVNSLTMLSAELKGRHYGGGVLELVPSEIERLLIPLPEKSSPALRKLDSEFRAGEAPKSILQAQDSSVLGALGISPEEQRLLYSAWDKLRLRRQRADAPSTPPQVEPYARSSHER